MEVNKTSIWRPCNFTFEDQLNSKVVAYIPL